MLINFPVVKSDQNMCLNVILQECTFGIIFPIILDYFSNIYKWDWKNQPKHGVVVVPQSDQSELVT